MKLLAFFGFPEVDEACRRRKKVAVVVVVVVTVVVVVVSQQLPKTLLFKNSMVLDPFSWRCPSREQTSFKY